MKDKYLTFEQYRIIAREILENFDNFTRERVGSDNRISFSSGYVTDLLLRFTNQINHDILRKYSNDPIDEP